MKAPPLVARVRLHCRGRSLRLWVPLIVGWLLLAVLLAPLLVLLLLVALLAPRRWRFLPLAGGAYDALCETRGSSVEFERECGRIFVSLH